MAKQPQGQNPVPQIPQPVRETFHDDFFRRAQQFCLDTFALVPELEGLAVIPSWEVRQEHLPFGVIIGRNGQLVTPSEVYHMAEQLHGALNNVMRASYDILKFYDERLGDMAEEIRAKQAQLERLNADIAAAESKRGGDSGAAPDPA